jgi:glycerate-2-kinase
MAAALEQILGDRIAESVVVTKHGHSAPTRRIRVLEASHPLPGEDSVDAGKQILRLAESAAENDLVVCLLSGGASALMEAPIDGITLQDLQKVTDHLLCAGAGIEDLNAIRRCLSRIKSGGLASAASPAALICLVISDVMGNDLSIIGSGPCFPAKRVSDLTEEIMDRYGLRDKLPSKVILAISASPPSSTAEPCPHHIIGDLHTALEACRIEAESLGLKPQMHASYVTGEAAAVGRFVSNLISPNGPNNCLIAGGETTVIVRGAGKGGRAQELAAAASESLRKEASLLSASTDGTDGPTDAAGGLVDSETFARAEARGILPAQAMAKNDSYHLLEAADSLVFTGPTQSNVNDLVILVNAVD